MAEESMKAELLRKMRETHQQLEDALVGLSAEEMQEPGVSGEWSVKDLLAHLTAWEQNVLIYFNQAMRGEEPAEDKVPGESNQERVQRINETQYQRDRMKPLDAVLADFAGSYRQMYETIEGVSEEDAAPGGRIEQVFGDSLEDCFKGDTWEHYEEHAASISEWRARREGAGA